MPIQTFLLSLYRFSPQSSALPSNIFVSYYHLSMPVPGATIIYILYYMYSPATSRDITVVLSHTFALKHASGAYR